LFIIIDFGSLSYKVLSLISIDELHIQRTAAWSAVLLYINLSQSH